MRGVNVFRLFREEMSQCDVAICVFLKHVPGQDHLAGCDRGYLGQVLHRENLGWPMDAEQICNKFDQMK